MEAARLANRWTGRDGLVRPLVKSAEIIGDGWRRPRFNLTHLISSLGVGGARRRVDQVGRSAFHQTQSDVPGSGKVPLKRYFIRYLLPVSFRLALQDNRCEPEGWVRRRFSLSWATVLADILLPVRSAVKGTALSNASLGRALYVLALCMLKPRILVRMQGEQQGNCFRACSLDL